MKTISNSDIFKGRYRMLRKLGEGGSSRVYMAIDTKSAEAVTVKCIKTDVKGGVNKGCIAADEINILDSIDHRAVPKVRGVYEDCVVLDYIPGNSLEKVIKHRGKFREKEAVGIVKELLDILKYLHGRKNPVIYRDLKPANIIIKPDGHVSLIDFGAARFYQKGEGADTNNLGTYGFAAPEQFGNLGQTDPRTDIYCLGKTLELIIKGSPSKELSMIIDKCTRPDREDRFTSCSEIEQALYRYPLQLLKRRTMQCLRLSFMAAAAALIVSFSAVHYEDVRSLAALDARARIPAVRERLGNAGLRIKGFVLEKFGDGTGEEMTW